LYYKWTVVGLILWVSWIDDCLVLGPAPEVAKAQKQMTDRFNRDVTGNMDEYVDRKLERNLEAGSVRFTQPVQLQSFQDEFNLPKVKDKPNIPAEAGQVLPKPEEGVVLPVEEQKTYRSGVGKLLHVMRWSRPDVLNAVRELSRFMMVAAPQQMKAMYRVMSYCVATPKRALVLKPERKWDGSPTFQFRIRGKADSTFASCPTTMRSIGGQTTLLEGAPVIIRSKMKSIVALSVT
jgi:hypothetical protein